MANSATIGKINQASLKVLKILSLLFEKNMTMNELVDAMNDNGLGPCNNFVVSKYINTCKSYHPEICTTHTYEDRLNTTKLVKKYGMELCSGVILGMGESVEQRIEMALELADGFIVDAKTSALLTAPAALILNALKHLAGIKDDLPLLYN